jgi:hypothetical protein
MSDIIETPFTDEQVKGLNEYQLSGAFHEFTCGNDNHPKHGKKSKLRILVAHTTGWVCPGCGYRQYWAHNDMANGAMVNAMNRWKDKLKARGIDTKNLKAPHTVCGTCGEPDCNCGKK